MTTTNKNKKKFFLIVGAGISSIGAAKLLNKEGAKVVILESKSRSSINLSKDIIDQTEIEIFFDTEFKYDQIRPFLKSLSGVIIPPGISWQHPTIKHLRKLKINIMSEIDLAWSRLNSIPWVGITGTNGKSTVTEMLNHVINSSGISSIAGGNIGYSASELALSIQENKIKPEVLIMELSSYQIETTSCISPTIGIFTSFSEDHLDRHKTLLNYFSIKKSLLDNSEIRIYNADSNYIIDNRVNLKEGLWISTSASKEKPLNINYWIDNEGYIYEDHKRLFKHKILNLIGNHNLQNLLLVIAAARYLEISIDNIKQGISTFKGIEHRLELIFKNESLQIFNDSKATNFESSTVALESMQSTCILLAGGISKEGSPSQWINAIKKNANSIILFGLDARKLGKILLNAGIQNFIEVDSLEHAIKKSLELASENNVKNILFSPACASFDKYANFEERGKHFKKLIKSQIYSEFR